MSGSGEGRVTSSRSLLTAVAVVVALAVVWGVSSFGGSSGAPPPSPSSTFTPPAGGIETTPLRGRLVFAADAEDGTPALPQRLYAYDLAGRTVARGPRIPAASELVALADGSILVTSERTPGRLRPSIATSLAPDADVRTLPSGSIVAASADGRAVVVIDPSSRACRGRAGYVERGFRFVLGSPSPIPTRGDRGCGTPISAAAEDGSTTVSVLGEDGHIDVLIDGTPVQPPLRDVAVLAIGPTRTVLLAAIERPRVGAAAVGPLLVWPSAGAPRPAVVGLEAERFLAWSPDGERAVVIGSLDGVRAMWSVDPASGTAQPVLTGDGVDVGAVAGATFDDAGNAFGVSGGAIIVSTRLGSTPLEFPADAPVPSGPVVWLP